MLRGFEGLGALIEVWRKWKRKIIRFSVLPTILSFGGLSETAIDEVLADAEFMYRRSLDGWSIYEARIPVSRETYSQVRKMWPSYLWSGFVNTYCEYNGYPEDPSAPSNGSGGGYPETNTIIIQCTGERR